jgi:hypothetical protein
MIQVMDRASRTWLYVDTQQTKKTGTWPNMGSINEKLDGHYIPSNHLGLQEQMEFYQYFCSKSGTFSPTPLLLIQSQHSIWFYMYSYSLQASQSDIYIIAQKALLYQG